MRYTTVIDISEYPAIYRSTSARMIYLHLALKSGYHDNDRDLIDISIRRLAYDVGLTVGATRHALELLQREKIITREDTKWHILKWTVIAPPTPRTQKTATKSINLHDITQDQKEQDARREQEKQQAAEAYRQRVLNAVRQCSKVELQQWLQDLEEGRQISHHNVYIKPNKDNIAWLQKVIDQL